MSFRKRRSRNPSSSRAPNKIRVTPKNEYISYVRLRHFAHNSFSFRARRKV